MIAVAERVWQLHVRNKYGASEIDVILRHEFVSWFRSQSPSSSDSEDELDTT